MNYFLKERINWIVETVRIFGFINRQHIQRKFYISHQQAALDLREVKKLFPDLLTYNTSLKRYEAAVIDPDVNDTDEDEEFVEDELRKRA